MTIGGDGYAGFTTSFTFQDNNLAKLYFEADITNGASVPVFTATRNGKAANCSVTASLIKCEFKSVKNGETFAITFAVKPDTASDVIVRGGYSSTGYVVGGNNSHGDAWGIGGTDSSGNQIMSLKATYNADGDYAAGWGNGTLSTKVSNNRQSAKLSGLPANRWASVNDNGSTALFGGFPQVTIVVNGGDPASFQLAITYPKTTSAPKSYVHINSVGRPDGRVLPVPEGPVNELLHLGQEDLHRDAEPAAQRAAAPDELGASAGSRSRGVGQQLTDASS